MNIIPRNKHFHYWEIIWMLAKTDLKMRYQGSWLGAVWVFLKPFCLFLVMNFVFNNLFFKDTPDYSMRLLIAIILWSFFAETTMTGMLSLLAKSQILKKIYMPKWIVIFSSTLHSAIAFLFNLIILFLFLFFYYNLFPGILHILMFVVYIFLIYGISLTFAFITAPIFIRIRDLNQIWEVLLQVLFYASPIIYPITAVPARIQSVLYLNPMTLLIEHSKIALVDNGFARIDHLIIFTGIFLVCFFASLLMLRKTSKNLIESM